MKGRDEMSEKQIEQDNRTMRRILLDQIDGELDRLNDQLNTMCFKQENGRENDIDMDEWRDVNDQMGELNRRRASVHAFDFSYYQLEVDPELDWLEQTEQLRHGG